MYQVWVAGDWHLFSKKIDYQHPMRSKYDIQRIKDSIDELPIAPEDLFVHVGDICDPEEITVERLQPIFENIPCKKVLCKGNHDTESDDWYREVGFDEVCDILILHTLVFSHFPCIIDKDQINIHGHIHTEQIATMGSQYVNCYIGFPCINVEELLDRGIRQTPEDYQTTPEVKNLIAKTFDDTTRKVFWEKQKTMHILDLSSEFTLTPEDESAMMNEIIFDDIDQTEYWEQDDLYNPANRKKEPMAEAFHSKMIDQDSVSNLQKDAIQELKDLIKKHGYQSLNPKVYSTENKTIILELVSGSQTNRLKHKEELKILVKELKPTLKKKYPEVRNVSSGDGDEGCIYIDLKNMIQDNERKNPWQKDTEKAHIKNLIEIFIAQLPKETGVIPEFNYYPESTYGDMNILNIRQVKANNNNKQFLEIMYKDKTDIKKRIQSVILMNRDYFYDILNCNPDKLQSEELKAIKSTKELEKYADRILNSITYEEHTPAFALYSILNLMGTDSISYSDGKLIEFVKMLLYGDNMKDVFNFDRYINELIKAVQEIEDLYLNIIATNLKLFDIGVVQSTKKFTKINPTVYQEIEKYVNDPKNGIIQHDMSTTVYDFSKFHLGKVLLANDILMENPWLTPSRFIPRVHYYNYVIYTHGDTNQSYQYDKFIMNPIVYRHNTYTVMEELLDRIMKENPNNKVLIVSCNGAGIHLGKYTDSTNVTYSNNINLMEATQNITLSNTMKKMLKLLEDKLELYTTLPLTLTWSLRNYEFLIPNEFKYITLGRKGNKYTIKMKELSSKRYSSNTVTEFYQEELMKSFNCILILYKAISYLIGLYYNIDTVKEIPFQENVIGKLLSQYEVYTPYGYLGKNSYDIAYKII